MKHLTDCESWQLDYLIKKVSEISRIFFCKKGREGISGECCTNRGREKAFVHVYSLEWKNMRMTTTSGHPFNSITLIMIIWLLSLYTYIFWMCNLWEGGWNKPWYDDYLVVLISSERWRKNNFYVGRLPAINVCCPFPHSKQI